MTGRRIDRRTAIGAGFGAALGLAGISGASAQGRESILVIRDQSPSYAGDPVDGGELAIVRPPASVDDFNPASFRMDYQVAISYLDLLVRPDARTLAPSPGLAESWQVSDDGLIVRYTLREGVSWHDGSPLTAADVAFSLDVHAHDLDSASANAFVAFVGAEALDDRTVVVTLSANDPTWLFNASSVPILQRAQYGDAWDAQPEGLRTLAGFDWQASPPQGTGPWIVEDWSESGVRLRRNDAYWDGTPWFEWLNIQWQAGQANRVEMWANGETDVLWPLEPGSLPDLRRRSGRLYAADAPSVMFAAFNFDHRYSPIPTVFNDVRVRQALSLAVDRGAIADAVHGGFAEAFAAGTVSQPWAHDAEIRSPDPDPEGAIALLNEAGWFDYTGDGYLADGVGNPLALVVLARNDGRPDLLRTLARVKRDWDRIGVIANIQLVAPAEFDQRWRKKRDYDLIAYAYDQFPGFTDFDLYGSAWDVRRNVLGWNPGGYANPDADAAIAAYLAATTLETQREALLGLQRAVNDDLFGIWLGFPQDLVLVADDVLGFRPDMAWQTAGTRSLWREPRGG